MTVVKDIYACSNQLQFHSLNAQVYFYLKVKVHLKFKSNTSSIPYSWICLQFYRLTEIWCTIHGCDEISLNVKFQSNFNQNQNILIQPPDLVLWSSLRMGTQKVIISKERPFLPLYDPLKCPPKLSRWWTPFRERMHVPSS